MVPVAVQVELLLGEDCRVACECWCATRAPFPLRYHLVLLVGGVSEDVAQDIEYHGEVLGEDAAMDTETFWGEAGIEGGSGTCDIGVDGATGAPPGATQQGSGEELGSSTVAYPRPSEGEV